ncbi:Bro-N domain-containing protein [Stutzerimonas stutzeri]|uniref:BRO-N domain-containing protein n=1 Tax=Stutzerimonas stutzeri TaxID=316 RepID=UPI003AFB272C
MDKFWESDETSKVNRISLGLPGGKPMVLVSEADLYKLVMRSDKPEARAFQDWVTRHGLPRRQTRQLRHRPPARRAGHNHHRCCTYWSNE